MKHKSDFRKFIELVLILSTILISLWYFYGCSKNLYPPVPHKNQFIKLH